MINFIPLIFNFIPLILTSALYFGIFCLVTVGLIYFLMDNDYLKRRFDKSIIRNLNVSNFEVRVFFLLMGIIIIVSELIQCSFQKEVHLQFIPIIIALISLFLAFKYNLIHKNKILVECVLLGIFFTYQSTILFRLYLYGNSLVYSATIIILFYAASIVIKRSILFLVNVLISFVYLFVLLKLNKISSYDFYVLIPSIMAAMLVSYGKRISILYAVKNFEFSKELVSNSSALLCAFDKYGNLLYVNNAVTAILGYNTKEVRGKQFWKLVQDPDYVDIDYNELYQDDRTYVRKLTAKSGEFRYILWSEKKIHDNLFVSNGQDITVSYLQQQDYETLFDNISEIVYELDIHGKFIKINTFAEKVCGYSKNELNGVFFINLVFKDDLKHIEVHYKQNSKFIVNNKPVEFRILKKDGGYLWVSQIVNTKLDSNGRVFGFTAVARVITEEKEKRINQKSNILKNIEFQNIVNDLYALKLSGFDLINNIKNIIEKVNSVLNIDKVSIWKYSEEGIKLEYLHLFDSNYENNTLEENHFLSKAEFPNYFASMEKYNSLIINDVELNEATSELYTDYFKTNNIKSLLDQVITINGSIDRIICFEQIHNRNWTEDEIRFTRTIANYLALIIERNEKSKIEYLLQRRGKILNSINKINSQLIRSNNFIDILNCNYGKIGEISNISRLFFYENKRGSNFFALRYKWQGSKIEEKIGMHTYSIFNIENYPEIKNQFEQQGYFSANKNSTLSESLTQLFDEINIKTLLLLPLYINGNLFGFIGLDDSEKNKSWQKEDIDIFISFAKNLESIIERVNFLGKIKENEQKFELLANNIPAGVYLLKYKSRTSSKIYFNDKLEQITGYSLNDFYTNKISFIDLYHPEDKETAKRAIYVALKTRGTYTIKSRIIHKSGKIVNIEEYGGTIVINDKIAYIEGVVIAIPENE